VIFTGIAHSFFISGLKNVKAQTASVVSSLEPIYGIVFAGIFLSELPSLRESFGGIIILGTGLYSTLREN
jgi:drug/metabolite transporter (DMT)-like permease